MATLSFDRAAVYDANGDLMITAYPRYFIYVDDKIFNVSVNEIQLTFIGNSDYFNISTSTNNIYTWTKNDAIFQIPYDTAVDAFQAVANYIQAIL